VKFHRVLAGVAVGPPGVDSASAVNDSTFFVL
jgi:hypothetical protein